MATVQGYGLTEKSERGKLLEVNVTVISNEDCTEQLKYNASRNAKTRDGVSESLPKGIRGRGLFCTRGERIGTTNKNKASCKGDSGGPVKTLDPSNDRRETLIGVVSGGIGCGSGIPPWYTRLSFHARWFNCIIDQTKWFLQQENFNQKKVESVCERFVKPEPSSEDFSWTLS